MMRIAFVGALFGLVMITAVPGSAEAPAAFSAPYTPLADTGDLTVVCDGGGCVASTNVEAYPQGHLALDIQIQLFNAHPGDGGEGWIAGGFRVPSFHSNTGAVRVVSHWRASSTLVFEAADSATTMSAELVPEIRCEGPTACTGEVASPPFASEVSVGPGTVVHGFNDRSFEVRGIARRESCSRGDIDVASFVRGAAEVDGAPGRLDVSSSFVLERVEVSVAPCRDRGRTPPRGPFAP